jgi:hypothetical protein
MTEGVMNYVDEYRVRRDAMDIKYKMSEKIKNGGTASQAKETRRFPGKRPLSIHSIGRILTD